MPKIALKAGVLIQHVILGSPLERVEGDFPGSRPLSQFWSLKFVTSTTSVLPSQWPREVSHPEYVKDFADLRDFVSS